MGVLKVYDGADWHNVGCGGGSGGSTPTTFTYLASTQTFVVPTGVTTLTVECWGAQGGIAGGSTNTLGLGGYIKADIAVTPGETLNVLVGQQPNSSGNGGLTGALASGGIGGSGTSRGAGGGGSSDVRQGGTALANRVVVAGGGGGSGVNTSGPNDPNHEGGPGGGATGGTGYFFGDTALPGKGGTQVAGGAAGTPATGGTQVAAAGALGLGGQGAGDSGTGSGGGGGGYYGGGGGGFLVNFRMPGGGGGSNYSSGTIITNTQGSRSGSGQVVITYTDPSEPGRLKLWTGTEWVQECCDGDTGRPLKILVDGVWETAACMTPV